MPIYLEEDEIMSSVMIKFGETKNFLDVLTQYTIF